jgi:hypothetical protein
VALTVVPQVGRQVAADLFEGHEREQAEAERRQPPDDRLTVPLQAAG